MPKLNLFLLVYLIIVANSIQSQSRGVAYNEVNSNDGEKYFSKSYALIIGNSNYIDWHDLPGVQNDIKLVGDLFKQLGFKVTTALDLNSKNLENTIEAFISNYGYDEDARLLVYYAGHGHTITSRSGEEKGYLVPIDAPSITSNGNDGSFRSKALSMNQIKTYSEDIEVNHALFIFDACFAGSIFSLDRSIKDNHNIYNKIANPVRQFITSGSADESVPDQSIFRKYLINAFQGSGDVNQDGFITGIELGEFLREKLINSPQTKQTPQYGNIQSPDLEKGDFVFRIDEDVKIVNFEFNDEGITHYDDEGIEGNPCKGTTGMVTFVNEMPNSITLTFREAGVRGKEFVIPQNEKQDFYRKEQGVYAYSAVNTGHFNVIKSGEVWVQPCDKDVITINTKMTKFGTVEDQNIFTISCKTEQYGTVSFKNNLAESITVTFDKSRFVIPSKTTHSFYKRRENVYSFNVVKTGHFNTIKSGEVLIKACEEEVVEVR